MKKLIIVTGSLGAGGIEKVTSRIANYYINKKYKVSIICLLESENKVFVTLDKKVDIYFFDKHIKGKVSKLFMVFKWIAFLKEKFSLINPDYVLCMTLKIGALCSLAKGRKKFRLSFRETSDPKSHVRNRFFDSILCLFCIKIDGIIFQTNWEKSCYPRFLQVKGKVIPNPVSVGQYNSDAFEKNVVTMGRLNNIQKRHDILIKAFEKFSFLHPGYVLRIYGDGPDREKDIMLIKELHVEKKVFLEKPKNNVEEEIFNASMFVMTSDFEGLSNALIEAQLLGIPCISSNWPGSEEIIKDKENGLIYKRQNIDQLSRLMGEIVSNINLRDKIIENGKKTREKYEPSSILQRYSEVIEGNK